MEKDSIDQLFSERLRNHEVDPKTATWAVIEKELAGSQRKSWHWIWIAASILLVLVAGRILLTTTTGDVENEAFDALLSQKPGVKVAVVNTLPVFVHISTSNQQALSQSTPAIEQQDKPINNVDSQTENAPISENNKKISGIVLSAESAERLSSIKEATLSPVLEDETFQVGHIEPDNPNPDNIVTASTKPVTIIYKQGVAQERSKFVQAIDFMDDVRKGEKKLINFKKLKASIKAKREAKNSK